MDKGKGLAILIADKIRGEKQPEGEVDYKRMAKDLIAAIESKNVDALSDILEAICTMG